MTAATWAVALAGLGLILAPLQIAGSIGMLLSQDATPSSTG